MGRAALATAIALIVGACTSGAPAAGQASKDPVAGEAVALRSTGTQPPDLPFEDLVAKVDFAKAYGTRADSILDQLRKTRAAVELRATHTSAQGPRLASVGAVVGNFSFAQFANDFGFELDDVTARGLSATFPSIPFSATESGKDTTTTTTLSVTETFSGAGSVVTATVHWSYSTITIDTSPTGGGATIFHLTDDRDFKGTIDVCPDTAGAVPATLIVSSRILADSAGAKTTRSLAPARSTAA